MEITGDILRIKNKRDNINEDIRVAIDKIVYVTHLKDGRYYQPFEFIDTLQAPLLITGDQLARTENKYLAPNDHEFSVYDRAEETYILNPNKHLLVSMEYDFDTAETILTAITYTVTVSPAEYKQLQSRTPSAKGTAPGKNRRGK